MRRLALLLAGAAALAIAVPASASHHPPSAKAGLVTMSVTRQNAQLTFNYTVTQQPCPNPHCDVNFGKPYRIAIWVDAPGASTGVGNPSPLRLSAPPHCSVAGQPLVDCNAPGRSQTDPAAALPMSGMVKVRVGTLPGGTAEIVVAEYSLDTYQEGVPVPPHDCSGVEGDVHLSESFVINFEKGLRDEFAELSKIENAAFVRFRVGELYYHLRERAIDEVLSAERSVRRELTRLNEKREAYAACLQVPATTKGRSSFRAATCTEAEWRALLDRARALKFKNIRPLVRKIAKAKKPARVRHYMRKLRALMRPEIKRLKALTKAVDGCF